MTTKICRFRAVLFERFPARVLKAEEQMQAQLHKATLPVYEIENFKQIQSTIMSHLKDRLPLHVRSAFKNLYITSHHSTYAVVTYRIHRSRQ